MSYRTHAHTYTKQSVCVISFNFRNVRIRKIISLICQQRYSTFQSRNSFSVHCTLISTEVSFAYWINEMRDENNRWRAAAAAASLASNRLNMVFRLLCVFLLGNSTRSHANSLMYIHHQTNFVVIVFFLLRFVHSSSSYSVIIVIITFIFMPVAHTHVLQTHKNDYSHFGSETFSISFMNSIETKYKIYLYRKWNFIGACAFYRIQFTQKINTLLPHIFAECDVLMMIIYSDCIMNEIILTNR